MKYEPVRAVLLALLVAAVWALPWQALVGAIVVPLLIYGVLANRTQKTKIRGATVLVTGASSGLGQQIAIDAARRGASRVILVARRAEKLRATAEEIGEAAIIRPCDISNADAVAELVRSVIEEFGAPDLLVNNAGAGAWLHIEESTPEDAVHHMEVPYFGAVWLTQGFAPAMIARGSGHVLNVTSAASVAGIRGAVTYGCARWAMRALSQYLRADLHEARIGCTCLNAAEIADTEYFAEGNAGASSHQRIPALFLLPIIRKLSFSSRQTACAGLNAVEAGIHEATSPWYLLVPTKLIADIFPDVFHYFLRVGPNGRR